MKGTTHFRHLVGELDYYEPQDDLHDILTGKYLGAIQDLPQSYRQMYQDSDMHCEIQELSSGEYRITKIVKKREPGYSQGTEKFFVLDKYGKRVNLTEKEYNDLLGMRANPDDIFETDEVQLETLDHDATAPLDPWDVILDGTKYIQAEKQLIENSIWQQKLSTKDKIKQLSMLADGKLKGHEDSKVYSADWFPYPADKRIHHPRARKLARLILDNINLTKSQLNNQIKQTDTQQAVRHTTQELLKDNITPETFCQVVNEANSKILAKVAREIRKKIHKMLPSQAKNTVRQKLKLIESQVPSSIKHEHGEEIPKEDQYRLWNLWQHQQMKNHGSVELPPWEYQRKLLKKLISSGIDREEAQSRVAAAVKKHYNMVVKTPQVKAQKVQHDFQKPSWLENVTKQISD